MSAEIKMCHTKAARLGKYTGKSKAPWTSSPVIRGVGMCFPGLCLTLGKSLIVLCGTTKAYRPFGGQCLQLHKRRALQVWVDCLGQSPATAEESSQTEHFCFVLISFVPKKVTQAKCEKFGKHKNV